jgi:preprotein translocase subunit SecA
MRRAEQAVMLSVVDERWRSYLTQMEHMREGIGLSGYAQLDPLTEYKQQAFTSFQELTAEIQSEIVRILFHLSVEAMQPLMQPAATQAVAEETAAPSPRADQAGSGRDADVDLAPPPARPAASAASGALARATVRAGAAALPAAAPPAPRAVPPLPVRLPGAQRMVNVVESSAEGARRTNGAAAGGPGGPPPGRIGRNQPCWCGSGKKYKFCHGR